MSLLVVDDNPAQCYALSQIARRAGHNVIEAHTGLSALQIAQAYRPEIVLLDVYLPDQTGFEVLSMLRRTASTKHLGVIIHTASEPTAETKNQALSLGADAYLTYPVAPPDLLAVIEGTLARVRKRRTDSSTDAS